MTRKLAAGNWKMNGTQTALSELENISAAHPTPKVDILICPPSTLVASAATRVANGSVQIGGQDCHANASGAHTGDISAAMLADAGASHVILGHSERREDHGETSEQVRQKVEGRNQNLQDADDTMRKEILTGQKHNIKTDETMI